MARSIAHAYSEHQPGIQLTRGGPGSTETAAECSREVR